MSNNMNDSNTSANELEELEEKEDAYKLRIHLKKDIYSFVILLFDKQLFSQIKSPWMRANICFCATGGFAVQCSGLAFFVSDAIGHGYSTDEAYIYDCNEFGKFYDETRQYFLKENKNGPVIYNKSQSNLTLSNQVCNIFVDYWAPHINPVLSTLFFGKLVAAFMTIIYIIDDAFMIPKFALIIPNTKNNWVILLWFLLFAFYVFSLSVTIAKIFVIISNSDSAIDILSVGLGFIILMEIDNKLFESFEDYYETQIENGLMKKESYIKKQLKKNIGASLFELRYTPDEIKYTMFDGNTDCKHKCNLITFILCLIGTLILIILNNALYARYNGFWLGEYGHTTVIAIGWGFMGATTVFTIISIICKFFKLQWCFWTCCNKCCNKFCNKCFQNSTGSMEENAAALMVTRAKSNEYIAK